MISKLDMLTIVSEFDSHWVPHISGSVTSKLSLVVNEYISISLNL